MTGKRLSAVLAGMVLSAMVGLVGCSEETKRERKETISTPGGTTTTTQETKVKSTGENPPPNSAGKTGESGK